MYTLNAHTVHYIHTWNIQSPIWNLWYKCHTRNTYNIRVWYSR